MERIIIPILLLTVLSSLVCAFDCDEAQIRCVGSGQEHSTIQSAADVALAGDTVVVFEGTYEERISVANSGTSGNYITYVGYWDDEKPVMRGFDISGKNYIKIIGFEIHQLDWGNPTHGIYIGGGSQYIEILNNYLHHVVSDAGGQIIRVYPSDHVIIRGNDLSRGACPGGEGACGCNGYGIGGHQDAHFTLSEYNHIHDIGSDFTDFAGTNSIARNNYMHTVEASLWSCLPHVDFFQAGSDGVAMNVRYHVYESNVLGDNPEDHSHIFQMRDSTNTGDHDMIIRGNVAYNVGSYIQQAGGIDRVFNYNNAYYKTSMRHQSSWGSVIWHNVEQSNNPSIDNYVINNIVYDANGNFVLGLDGTSAGSGSEVDFSDNICFMAKDQEGCLTTDPGFVDEGSYDFHLQQTSPAVDTGRTITTTTDSGSGTTFNVDEAGFFTDGFGLADGDIITVGSNDPVKITDIDRNTITVDSTITWNSGDAVNWRYDSIPDIGAYPYRTSYEITNTISYNVGTITATINDPTLVRFVEFVIDGIPVALDYDAPYEFSWDTNSEEMGSRHQIKAIARPLYADKTLAYTDSEIVTIGQSTGPICGSNGCEAGEDCSSCPEDCGECQCIHDADNNPCDGVVSTEELAAYIDEWKAGTVNIQDLMGGIVAWKKS